MKRAEALAGFDAELLDQSVTGGAERGERVGLPAASVEGEHLQLDEVLGERVGEDERVELTQDLALATELEIELDALHGCLEPLLLEPSALGGEDAVEDNTAQRLPAPEPQAGVDLGSGRRRLTGFARLACPPDGRVPLVKVAIAAARVEHVAIAPADEPSGVRPRRRTPCAAATRASAGSHGPARAGPPPTARQ